MVSINCITYNHENYIREALDSFLMQKTNFNYEILIHDDASTDNTAEIILEYERKYPNIVKPIIQKENQQSQGIKKVSHRFNHTRAKGKYIAFCEGDDYWIDDNKLQKQVDYMESNPNCTFCFHNAYVLQNEKKSSSSRLVIPWLSENRKFYYGKSINYFSGELQLLGFIPTASFMFPRYVLDNPPEWFFEAPVGDNPIKLIASSFGYAHYINEPMCIYRFNVPNSATTKWRNSSLNQAVQRCNKFIKMLDDFNEYSNYRYSEDIEISKLTWEIQKFSLIGDRKTLRKKNYKRYLDIISGSHKIKFYLLLYFPFVFSFLKKIKGLFRRN